VFPAGSVYDARAGTDTPVRSIRSVHRRRYALPDEKGVPMRIVGVHQVPSLTRERYEEVIRRLTDGRKSRADSAADLPFPGLLAHAAGEGKNGFYVIDVWESQEAVDGFREIIGTLPIEVGIEEGPDFFPAHTFFASEATL
jgi:hypothetical protein